MDGDITNAYYLILEDAGLAHNSLFEYMRTTFKYELQDHNQIYQEPHRQFPLKLQATPHTHPPHHEHSDSDSIHPPHLHHTQHNHKKPQQPHKKQNKTQQSVQQPLFQQSFDEHYIEKVLCLKSSYQHHRPEKRNKNRNRQTLYEPEDLDIFLYSSESPRPARNIATPLLAKNRKDAGADDSSQEKGKEASRQKRGLASISEKVKDIVAANGRMTFKEVSDELLKTHPLPANPDVRKREMSNIRRRVYDALNVLLTVGILQKQQRHVLPTDLTSVPGKKHSKYWDQINDKKKVLGEMKQDYQHKQHIYHLLQQKMQLIKKLHQRNRQLQSHKQTDHKFSFPLVCWIPQRNSGKISVNIEHLQGQKQRIKKYTIEGPNQSIQTDIDMLKYINLAGQKRYSQQDFAFLREKDQNFYQESPCLSDKDQYSP